MPPPSSPDLRRFTRQADRVVAAVGRRNTLTADRLKPDAIMIDVGMNRVADDDHPTAGQYG